MHDATPAPVRGRAHHGQGPVDVHGLHQAGISARVAVDRSEVKDCVTVGHRSANRLRIQHVAFNELRELGKIRGSCTREPACPSVEAVVEGDNRGARVGERSGDMGADEASSPGNERPHL
jgi:hypothetical protein